MLHEEQVTAHRQHDVACVLDSDFFIDLGKLVGFVHFHLLNIKKTLIFTKMIFYRKRKATLSLLFHFLKVKLFLISNNFGLSFLVGLF